MGMSWLEEGGTIRWAKWCSLFSDLEHFSGGFTASSGRPIVIGTVFNTSLLKTS